MPYCPSRRPIGSLCWRRRKKMKSARSRWMLNREGAANRVHHRRRRRASRLATPDRCPAGVPAVRDDREKSRIAATPLRIDTIRAAFAPATRSTGMSSYVPMMSRSAQNRSGRPLPQQRCRPRYRTHQLSDGSETGHDAAWAGLTQSHVSGVSCCLISSASGRPSSVYSISASCQ